MLTPIICLLAGRATVALVTTLPEGAVVVLSLGAGAGLSFLAQSPPGHARAVETAAVAGVPLIVFRSVLDGDRARASTPVADPAARELLGTLHLRRGYRVVAGVKVGARGG